MEIETSLPRAVSLPDVIRGMRGRVGVWRARGWLAPFLMFLLYRRLGEIDRLMEGLVARFRAGRVLRRGARAGAGVALAGVAGPDSAQAGPTTAVDCCASRAMTGDIGESSGQIPAGQTPVGQDPAGQAPAWVRPAGARVRLVTRLWPGKFGWLVGACSHEAAGFSAQLRFVLTQPEMVALLTACPQAGRVLGPLCRALAVETALLRPGVVPVVRAARPVLVRKKRMPRAKIDWGRIPLPRGMLSWARREGFGKVR